MIAFMKWGLLALLVMGCGDTLEWCVYDSTEHGGVCQGFHVKAEAPELLEACEVAAARWGKTAGVSFGCASGRPLRYEAPQNACAWSGTNTDRVAIRRETTLVAECGVAHPVSLAHAIAHELGHVMTGTGSHAEGSGLMSNAAPEGAPITAADLEWLCTRIECSRFAPE